MNEKSIQIELYKDLSRRSRLFTVPNISTGYGEADLFSLTKAMFSHEYEIKVSRSDFKADFKHKHYKHAIYSGECGLRPSHERPPNHFWYAVPEGLISVDEVPHYAGLIEICTHPDQQRVYVKEIKPAPKLHKEKVSQMRLLSMVKGVEWRYWREIDKSIKSPNQG